MSEHDYEVPSGRGRLFIARTETFITSWVSLCGLIYLSTGLLGLKWKQFAGVSMLQSFELAFMLSFGIYAMGVWMGMRPSKEYFNY